MNLHSKSIKTSRRIFNSKIAEMTYCDVKSIFIKTNENYTDENFGKITQLYIVLGKIKLDLKNQKERYLLKPLK